MNYRSTKTKRPFKKNPQQKSVCILYERKLSEKTHVSENFLRRVFSENKLKVDRNKIRRWQVQKIIAIFFESFYLMS